MMGLDLWVVWIGVGIALMILEIFTPGFVLGLIGFSGVLTGISVYLGANNYIALGIFIISNLLLFIFVRKIMYNYFFDNSPEKNTNVDAIIGKKGVVMSDVEDGVHGEAKIGGEIWYAVPFDTSKKFTKDSRIEVVKVEGSKIYIKGVE